MCVQACVLLYPCKCIKSSPETSWVLLTLLHFYSSNLFYSSSTYLRKQCISDVACHYVLDVKIQAITDNYILTFTSSVLRDYVIGLIGKPEINENNPQALLRRTTNTKKSAFLRALFFKFLGR